jgi:hypothetical protein
MPFVPAATVPGQHPHRRRASRILGTAALLFLLAPAVFVTPRAVNAAAWLAGAGRPDAFTGLSYGSQCSGGSCATVTGGTLASTGQRVTWPGRVPLGKPVPVRDPLWDVMHPRFDEGTGDALAGAALGLFFDAIAVSALAVAAVRARARTARTRDRRASPRSQHTASKPRGASVSD